MTLMSLRSILTTLFTVSAVFASPTPSKRAPGLSVYNSCTKPNDLALTFDDGPWIYLRQISDAFTKASAKATFFFNGNNWDCIYNPDRISDIKYAYNAGHMIGSHTWSHADLIDLSTPQIQDAMYRMEEAFSRILGIKPAFMRPPYGDYNDNVQNIAFARGQSLALWDWDTGDADGNTTSQSEAVYNQIANNHLSTALVLEHETETSTANTLVPYAINLFQSKGYKLVTLAECVGVEPYAAVGVPQQQTSAWTCNGTPNPGEACGGSILCSTGAPVFSSTISTSSTSTTTTTSTSSTTTTSTSSTTTTTSTGSSGCGGVAAWQTGIAYNGGQQVTYNGHLWTAKWWSFNDVPGGSAGDWTDNGACSNLVAATAKATASAASSAVLTASAKGTELLASTGVASAPKETAEQKNSRFFGY